MKIKKLLPPIHIHPILIIFIIISVLTGTFVEMLVILSIVLFHELGHYLAAAYFKWRVRQVMLWVFGGVMDTDEFGNKPFHEEIIVTIAGPFQHVIIYFIVYIGSISSFIPESLVELILLYNTSILIFNLLPIWPLDGGKLLFFLLSINLPYQKAYHSIVLFSMIFAVTLILLQLLLYPFTLSVFLILVFLLIENRSEWNKRHYVFIRFLLNRYNGDAQIKSINPLTVSHQTPLMAVFSQFRRDKRHPIYVRMPDASRLSIDENDCLRSYFFDKQYDKSIGEIATSVIT